jgi:RimJ/RimL family protein N-acetyltransferase
LPLAAQNERSFTRPPRASVRSVVSLEAHPLASDDLEAIEPWFRDLSTTRWLGSADYPRRLLGWTARPGRWAFVLSDAGEPVALVDVECDQSDASSAAVAVVVAPSRRRAGLGRCALAMIVARPELALIREFVGEVEEGNTAAARCVIAAGFRRKGSATDIGYSRYVLRKG